jgi:hypothetical protein
VITSQASGYQATDGAAYQIFFGSWTEVLASVFLDVARMTSDGQEILAAFVPVGCGCTRALAGPTFPISPVGHRFVALEKSSIDRGSVYHTLLKRLILSKVLGPLCPWALMSERAGFPRRRADGSFSPPDLAEPPVARELKYLGIIRELSGDWRAMYPWWTS